MGNQYICELNDGNLTVGNSQFCFTERGVDSYTSEKCDNSGLSAEFLQVKATIGDSTKTYSIWEGVPAVEITGCDGIFTYPLKGNNYTLRVIKLYAVTDYHDDFTDESVYCMFRGKISKKYGNLFFLDDPLTKESIVFISTAPDYAKVSFEAEDSLFISTDEDGGLIKTEKIGEVRIDTCGHGIVVGKCKTEECEKLCRLWYRHKCKPTELYTMANTWGDLNAWRRVADDFIKAEIDASAEIGLDTLQIDDGWQTGNTSDPTIRDERRRRLFKGDFWKLNTEKFKKGMEEMRDYAEEKGVKLGLWFAPDSQNCYERKERDLAVLEKAYKEWNMRYFKFDMLYVDDMDMYKAFEDLLHKVYSFGDDVFVQLDVTNGVRNGYLGVTQYGRIFAENRYTKLRTYYPHRTLHNLWNIGKYIPAYKFQFELVNPTLNDESYGDDDLFAPSKCDIDYLFAITMMSNPLFWMEVQFLPEKQKEKLNRVFPIWKGLRKKLADADVIPVGECPNGCTFTGFVANCDDNKAYLLVFREVNEQESFAFNIGKKVKFAKVLASNSDIEYNVFGDKVEVTFGKMRSYALIELQY